MKARRESKPENRRQQMACTGLIHSQTAHTVSVHTPMDEYFVLFLPRNYFQSNKSNRGDSWIFTMEIVPECESSSVTRVSVRA